MKPWQKSLVEQVPPSLTHSACSPSPLVTTNAGAINAVGVFTYIQTVSWKVQQLARTYGGALFTLPKTLERYRLIVKARTHRLRRYALSWEQNRQGSDAQQ